MADGKIGGAWFELSVRSDKMAAELSAARATAQTESAAIGTAIETGVGGGAEKAKRSVADLAIGFGALGTVAVSAGVAISGILDKFLNRKETVKKELDDLTGSVQALVDTLLIGLSEQSLDGVQRRFSETARRVQGEVEAATARANTNLSKSAMLRSLANVSVGTKAIESLFPVPTEEEIIKEVEVAAARAADAVNRVYEDSLRKRAVKEQDEREKAYADLVKREKAAADDRQKAADAYFESHRKFYEFAEEQEKKSEERRLKGADLYNQNISDFIAWSRRVEKEQEDADKRLAEKRLRLELDNIKRAEDYRRSLAQGFGVGDVATTDLSSLTRAIQDLASTQIQTRD